MTLYGYKLPALSSLLLWALLWEIVGAAEADLFHPAFSEVVVTLFQMIPTPRFPECAFRDGLCLPCGRVLFAIVIGISRRHPDGKNRIVDEFCCLGQHLPLGAADRWCRC